MTQIKIELPFPLPSWNQILKMHFLEAQRLGRLDTPCRVHFHSIRRKLADLDNLSGKAVLDGIVNSGILRDDSPKEIKAVSHTQEKGQDEKTIVTITWD